MFVLSASSRLLPFFWILIIKIELPDFLQSSVTCLVMCCSQRSFESINRPWNLIVWVFFANFILSLHCCVPSWVFAVGIECQNYGQFFFVFCSLTFATIILFSVWKCRLFIRLFKIICFYCSSTRSSVFYARRVTVLNNVWLVMVCLATLTIEATSVFYINLLDV